MASISSSKKKSSTAASKGAAKKTVVSKSASTKGGKAQEQAFDGKPFALLIFAIVALVISVAVFWGVRMNNTSVISDRSDRIAAIYNSLDLDSSYQITDTNIFGAKRTYESDASRTQASSVSYVHGDTVSTTFEELDRKVKAAGFTFLDEPYPGATTMQYHYKSDKNEYLRLSVSSKPYDDAIRNAAVLKTEADYGAYDKNTGPSNITIKVNLDDNNE